MKPRLRLGALVREHPLAVGFTIAAIVARVVFILMTDRYFEDALITVTHARNAADGLGLTHHGGEPVTHGFTSALSVLIPFAGELVVSGSSFPLMRVLGVVGGAAAVIAGYLIARRLRLGTWPTALVLAFLAFDQAHIFYGMAGMETQIAVAILLWTIVAMMHDRRALTGVGLGLCLLVRPDFALFVGPAFLWALLHWRRGVLPVIATFVLLVAPWVLFTTLYYGSPVPNTIVAKQFSLIPHPPALGDGLSAWTSYGRTKLEQHSQTYWKDFAPFLTNDAVVRTFIPWLALKAIAVLFAALAAFGALRTLRIPAWWPAIAFVAAFTLYRLFLLPPSYYGWYLPPYTAILILLVAAGLRGIGDWRPALARPAAALAVALAVLFSLHMPFTFPLEARVQKDIENQVRVKLGQYLGEVADGRTTVSESAGYVGYYSDVVLWDFPGLTSKRVTDHYRRAPAGSAGLLYQIQDLRPELVVLRGSEWESLHRVMQHLALVYEPLRAFSVTEEATPLSQWGVRYANTDREFVVLRRRDVPLP